MLRQLFCDGCRTNLDNRIASSPQVFHGQPADVSSKKKKWSKGKVKDKANNAVVLDKAI